MFSQDFLEVCMIPESLKMLSNPTDVIEKTKVGCDIMRLLRDRGYPLNKWLMKLYTLSPALSPQEKKFKKPLSSAWVVVERAFGVCKTRSRFLIKRLDNRLENVSNVFITCFI